MTSRPISVLARFLFLLTALALSSSALAQVGDPNACDDPSEKPNVIVGDIHAVQRWGNVGGITAFSIGTTSCNIGTCWLDWITSVGPDENKHPTIGQNCFRLMDGRFEQLGQSWLKHGFYALSENACFPDCLPTDGDHLGVHCSDPYSTNLNAQQDRLGPKFEVNPLTGFHPHPVTDQALTGDNIYKRLQVHDTDIDPALNPGARYFVEGQYVAQDDAEAGNQNDNCSYREVTVESRAPNPGWRFILADATHRTQPGIQAWADNDPAVAIMPIDDPEGGRYWIAGKATDLGGGWWHYEYALQNLTGNRAARRFAVPIPMSATTGSIGFHDVDYHSGEPFDGTDWSTNGAVNGVIDWSTSTFADDPNANALRWGTLYNFRFDCDKPPSTAMLTLDMFKPGTDPGEPDSISFTFLAPLACNGNGTCDPGETCVSCPGECTDVGPDLDGDGANVCVDCAEGDPSVWSVPSEVPMLLVHKNASREAILDWSAPSNPGGNPARYEAVRSSNPADFVTSALCVRGPDETLLDLDDLGSASAGSRLFYLVRARTRCPAGSPGTTGANSFGVVRSAVDCP